MTVKQAHALDHAWQMLHAACEEAGRMVSAGELAKKMGVSRNTAFSRIMDMYANEAIVSDNRKRGNTRVYRFGTWGYTFEGRE